MRLYLYLAYIMTKRLSFALLIAGLLLSLASCKTYYIPVDSFKQQFANIDTSMYREVAIIKPVVGGKYRYKIAPIDSIKCVDKTGKPVVLKNSPALEVRFTDSSNKQTVFYFDLLTVGPTYITGGQSRIFTSMRKTIPLNTIKTIEIQDDKKSLYYVKP